MDLKKKSISLILCILMIASVFVGCEDNSTNIGVSTSESAALDSVGADTVLESDITSETKHETETEAPEPEPEPEPSYTWVVDPGKSIDDIQPIYGYGGKIVDLGIMILDDKYLVDFNGDVKYTFPDKNEYQTSICSFCDLCHVIDCGNGTIDPDTYENVNHAGHGGYLANYIYDSETGSVYYPNYGEYCEISENVTYAVVAQGIKRPSTPEDNMAADYVYDMNGLYGIVINSKLVVPFEYDAYVGFDSSGIAALRKDGKWAFFDAAGRMILENAYSASSVTQQMYANDNSELVPYTSSSGYIALNRDGKWGYADLDGNIVIDHVFEEARPVYCGKAWVKTADGWGVIKIEEPKVITEEEAKNIVYNKVASSGVSLSDITPNGKSYYGCVGYGFDVKTTDTSADWHVTNYFVCYDGTVVRSQFYKN